MNSLYRSIKKALLKSCKSAPRLFPVKFQNFSEQLFWRTPGDSCFCTVSIIKLGYLIENTLKAFIDFKNKQKSVWSNVFLYVKVFIFWKFIRYIIHWDKTQMLKKLSLDKISGTKHTLFLLLRAPTHHSFTFNLRFIYELKHWKVHLSKTVCGIFNLWFRLAFIKVYIFIQQKVWTLWL